MMKTFKVFPVLLLALLFVAISCKGEKKAEAKDPETEIQSDTGSEPVTAEVLYQCPMDCEEGKTYQEPGTCPVCKMDLKPVSKETAMSCKMDADGNCSCEAEECACAHCSKHSGEL